jgi:hypothetical protein
MNSRTYKLSRLLLTSMMCVLFLACNDQIPYRSTVTGASTSTTAGSGSGDEDLPAKRPDGAVKFKADFCGCKDGVAVTYGNCSAFCTGKNTGGAERLYANFTVTEPITLSGLGNVSGWCNTLLPDDTANPSCVIEAKDSSGAKFELPVPVTSGLNSITTEIQGLTNNKTYVLTLVETVSGARSDSIQIIKFTPQVSTVLGPLKVAPISQYTCLYRNTETVTNSPDVYNMSAYRLHFYFLPAMAPNPVTGATNLICHDFLNPANQNIDPVLVPRLEQTPGIFSLWDSTDPRFFDNNGNGTKDINEVIAQKATNYGSAISATTNFFVQFTWPGSPVLSGEAGNTASPAQPIGYYMAPWIDQSTYKSYCPTSTHYNGTNALFKALRDVIQLDTEGLYIGEKAAETFLSSENKPIVGAKDYILIRETNLKSVWFYLDNGTPTAPTDSNVASVPVFFYYPLNKNTPYVRSSDQKIYRVRSAAELSALSSNATGANAAGANTSYPPHDRKIGCVPKLGNTF